MPTHPSQTSIFHISPPPTDANGGLINESAVRLFHGCCRARSPSCAPCRSLRYLHLANAPPRRPGQCRRMASFRYRARVPDRIVRHRGPFFDRTFTRGIFRHASQLRKRRTRNDGKQCAGPLPVAHPCKLTGPRWRVKNSTTAARVSKGSSLPGSIGLWAP
jgi:hypothetical protein